MALTRQQIEEFTKRARIAGLTDSQIAQEIEKKAREFGQTSNTIDTSYSRKTQGSSGVSKSTQNIPIEEESSGFLSTFIKGLISPVVEYGKFVGEAGYQAGRFAFDPTFRKAVLGEELTSEEAEKLSKEKATLLYGEEEARKKLGDRGKIAKTGLKATAGTAAYAIPFGKGAGLASKVFIPGAAVGALSEISREEATPESVIATGTTGAVTAGVLHGIGGMISWVRGKGGELTRQSEKLAEGARKIKVKQSVYGAGKEKVINQTLDKYGFKGTAQDQYEKLEPIMGEIEGKIQSFIKKNPKLAVSKESIKEAFMKNLKSSLRTADITKKQAVDEIKGYLNDLLVATGERGAETGQPLLKAGTKDIPLATLREMKKVLNEDSASVFKKLENGTPLNAREKVIAAAWDSLDDAIKNVAPKVKKLLIDESHLFQASQSLSSARFNPPVQRIMGTSVPAGLTQKLRELGQTVLKKLGIGVEKLPSGEVIQQSFLTKLGAMTPAILRERGLTEEEIKQVTETGIPLGEGVEGRVAGLGRVDNEPSALNPFGGLTKRQVQALALSQGAKMKDIKEVGEMYDMLASDNGVINEETMKTADSLRTEYFKRSQENNWIDILNSYKKVINTTDTAAGDVSLIFAYMKMLDPGSVVREGEFATAEQTAGVPDQIVKLYNKALRGDRLSDKQRDAFRKEAGRVFEVYQERQAPIDAYYQGLAQRYGIDPSLLGVGLYR